MPEASHFQEPLTPYEAEPAASKPVTCLGRTFASEAERRAFFRARLKEHLADPAFRQIEGFPIGDDEAILDLSDPPYYTACPNPFLPEILAAWRQGREEKRDERSESREAGEVYHREPFAADVSEGKNDPIYNAHSYHTKVPHKAIMRYILHYTEPGDIVFDGFCGSGMTGVAAQLCGDRKAVESLGYHVAADGSIYQTSPSLAAPHPAPVSRLGPRKAVLVDLSPAATFIAYNYNTPVDAAAFEREARRILREVEAECGWMYETWHPDCDHPQRVKGRINYTVWSEVFLCPQCSGEITFLDEALDSESLRVKEGFPCPHCGAQLSKDDLLRLFESLHDPVMDTAVKTLKRVPVLVEYTVGTSKYSKRSDDYDRELLQRIGQMQLSAPMPMDALPIAQMYHGSRLAPKGATHIPLLFLPRARHVLTALWAKAGAVADPRLRAFMLFTTEQAIWGMSLLARYVPTHFSQVNQYLTGVYYISSLISEVSPWYILDGKTARLTQAFAGLRSQSGHAAISTQSTTAPPPLANSVDYIFTDPPFGENIYYADLNYLVESWHGVRTQSRPEAIIDQAKRKTLTDYQDLMRGAFRSYYDWLKPGRWMTVEFHNSHNAVWNAIQEALSSAGFVVADVRTLDKQQSSYRQVTAASAAKQDLVISAYKPNDGLEKRFRQEAGTPEGVWDFVRQHLGRLPTVVEDKGVLETVTERRDYLLFDRMVAFHIQRGASVPLSAAEFYAGLRQRFIERDGMFFLPDQVPAYDRARMLAERVEQLALFVSDEKSALQWLRQQLDPGLGGRPQSYQDVQPAFLRQLHQAKHESLPELGLLLEQSFLQDEQGRWCAPDPNKAADLEAVRRKALLREFEPYRQGKGRLKQFRTEAVRAGFASCWQQRDYAAILDVAGRLPEQVLHEDAELLMYFDNASLRMK